WVVGNTPSTIAGDGRTLAQIDPPGVLRIVDVDTGAVRTIAELHQTPYGIDVSRDGKSVAVAVRDGAARVYDIATGTQRGRMQCNGIAWNVAFSRDGTKLAVACGDGYARVLDIAPGTVRELAGHSGAVAGVDFTSDGAYALSSGVDGTVRQWNLATGLGTIIHRAPAPILDVHPVAGTSLILETSFDIQLVRVWDTTALPSLHPDAATLRPWIDQVTTATIDESGRFVDTLR